MTTAAMPAVTATRIPLAAITPSKTNPRKSFDKVALEELAESIRKHDVIQPVTLRPNGGAGSYELVAGERRYRAAKIAGLVDIPATVRSFTDTEVLEIQIVENLQRKDLHPLEEAEGYEALLKCQHGDGKKYTVEEIMAKTSMSRSYVFGRLKLCGLCPEAREAFYSGQIDASKALLIARIGHHDTQRKALNDILKPAYGGDPMSTRAAQAHLVQHYTLDLKSAIFDIKDATLLPKAGACGPCPKRTGNQSDLFGDVKSVDVCTDPKCFDDKRLAHHAVAAKALEAKGHKVISGEAAKKLLPNWASSNAYSRDFLQGGYVRLTDTTYATGRSKPVQDVLGADFEPTLIQHPGTGEVIKVATQQAVTAAANRATKQRESSKGTSARKTAPAAPRVQGAAVDPEAVFEKLIFQHLFAALPTKLGDVELRWLLEKLLMGDADFELIEQLFLPPASGKASQGTAQRRLELTLPKLDADGLTRLAVAILLSEDHLIGLGNVVKSAVKHYRIDEKAVRAAATIEVEKSTPTKDAKPATGSKKAAKKS